MEIRPTIKTTEQERRFILHWGEMGARWGISRAVAQIHALLLISHEPLHAQQISEGLELARSNVSTGIRELESYGLISVEHVMGDRRDYFRTIKDSWQMFIAIADARIEREFKPTLAMLQKLQKESKKESSEFRARIDEMALLLEGGLSVYGQLRTIPRVMLKNLVRLDGKISAFVARVLGGSKR
jgi:DNA-binding transcriptional regulator GbsR (MarR family)